MTHKPLSEFWMSALVNGTKKAWPGDFDSARVVDAWKVDGYNDGTATLFGIFEMPSGIHERVTLPDYQPAIREIVIKKQIVTEVWEPKA